MIEDSKPREIEPIRRIEPYHPHDALSPSPPPLRVEERAGPPRYPAESPRPLPWSSERTWRWLTPAERERVRTHGLVPNLFEADWQPPEEDAA